ncbi:MAG: hypothetical protein ACKOUS_07575, partial [Alphaproteobacteria bacterium]
ALLRSQKDVPRHGWQVNNYEHSLQCATRALRNGETEEYIVCCLLHDVTQDLNPSNHDKSAADLLRYHVSDENHWVIANHQIFQLSFRDHSRFDRAARVTLHRLAAEPRDVVPVRGGRVAETRRRHGLGFAGDAHGSLPFGSRVQA